MENRLPKVEVTVDASGFGSVLIDGVKEQCVRRVELVAEAGELTALKIVRFASVAVEGPMAVERVTVCPSCEKEMSREILSGQVEAEGFATADISDMSSKWRKHLPAPRQKDGGQE